jgi:predicted TIM-barrel fold metal-dependent hydrolase
MAEDIASAANIKQDARNYWFDQGFAPGGVVRHVDHDKTTKGLHPSLKGIKIVDCDTHFSEPPDLFTSRAPAKYKDKVPQLKLVDGTHFWFAGERNLGVTGGNVIFPNNDKLLGRFGFANVTDGHPGCNQVKPRLQAMDDMGIYAQMCYHNSGVTQAGTLMSLGDTELAITILKIYNDGAAERQEASGQRLFTLAHLPVWDKAAMEAEAQRCIDMKLKGFVLADAPERLGVPSYIEPYWAKFFAMCEATGTPINFHLNSSMPANQLAWKGMSFEQTLCIASTMYSIGNASTLGNFMVSGLLDTFPKLKIGLIESGMGWVPFAIEAYEHQFDEMLPSSKVKLPERRPWEYFRDNFWVTYWFEKSGPKLLLETLGADKVLFETDFPHPTSLYPGVQEHLVETLGGYDYAVRKKVLETNAVKLYNLPF